MKQETIKGRASWLTALMAGAMLVSCSNDMQMPSGGADGSAEGKVTFNISLPSTEKVIYGGGTRALHDEAEYNVTTLDVYEYDVNTGFVAKHTFSAADGSIRPAGEGNITGEYTVTITEDLAEVGSLRRFYFVANNANGVTPAKGTDYETGLRDEAADIALASGTGSSVLCPEGGIAMSGLAVNTETNGSDITIKSGAMNNVHVDLTRIVGRVDLYSNADNLVITGARMEKAAEKGYLMADHSLTSTDMPGEIEMLDINANAGVAASGEACLPAANAGYSAEISTIQQYNDGNGTGVRKAFYMYERDNSEGDCTQIVVSYALADGTTGEAVVPFSKTNEANGEISYVNIERNHLYKVVLGNGEDITPGSEVEVKIIDTPWNVVDLPVVVEKPEFSYERQRAANETLFANRFGRSLLKIDGDENWNYNTSYSAIVDAETFVFNLSDEDSSPITPPILIRNSPGTSPYAMLILRQLFDKKFNVRSGASTQVYRLAKETEFMSFYFPLDFSYLADVEENIKLKPNTDGYTCKDEKISYEGINELIVWNEGEAKWEFNSGNTDTYLMHFTESRHPEPSSFDEFFDGYYKYEIRHVRNFDDKGNLDFTHPQCCAYRIHVDKDRDYAVVVEAIALIVRDDCSSLVMADMESKKWDISGLKLLFTKQTPRLEFVFWGLAPYDDKRGVCLTAMPDEVTDFSHPHWDLHMYKDLHMQVRNMLSFVFDNVAYSKVFVGVPSSSNFHNYANLFVIEDDEPVAEEP